MTPLVSVNIVTWNSARVLRHCLRSLHDQTYQRFRITIFDNGSIDETIAIAREEAPEASLVQKRRNIGFGAAHNEAILLSRTPFVLTLNPDTVLEPGAIERLVTVLEQDDLVAAVGPKLLRYRWDEEAETVVRTTTIDSTGIVMTRSGAFLDRGAGDDDRHQFDSGDVFALSAACCLYRRVALDDVRWGSQYFDADFFMYKEDVDLSWRLRRRGWRLRYDPTAVVFHQRGSALPRSDAPWVQRNARRQRPSRLRRLSYRNHLLTHWKNAPARDAVARLPWTLGYECGKFVFLLMTEPQTLAGFFQAVRLWPRMLQKRRALNARQPLARR